ncbi:hypothetical protein [Methylophaga pinxianii]|uniref:hypothetical protein n=1 Tax=Methylophaga pinxianii TaxID=2881052 RepID=UPI001CF254E9|nr:hypothetical protein [Methylophaga pinxianii]MCB2426303.1 hypothetical protein [Methylophaga pinxianii]UPH46690.1 hypothetical protein LGT42_005235 [Methylophaga pinxianii]
MADEIHPAQPLSPTVAVDIPADEKRRHQENERNENQDSEKDKNQPRKPPKTGIIDEYV